MDYDRYAHQSFTGHPRFAEDNPFDLDRPLNRKLGDPSNAQAPSLIREFRNTDLSSAERPQRTTDMSYIIFDQTQDCNGLSQSTRYADLPCVASVSSGKRYFESGGQRRPVAPVNDLPPNYPSSPPLLRSVDSNIIDLSESDRRIVRLQPLPESTRKPSVTEDVYALDSHLAPRPIHQNLALQPLAGNTRFGRRKDDRQNRVTLIPLNEPDHSIQRPPQGLDGSHSLYLKSAHAARDRYSRDIYSVNYGEQPLGLSDIHTTGHNSPETLGLSSNLSNLVPFAGSSSREAAPSHRRTYQEAHLEHSSIGTDRRIIFLPKDDRHLDDRFEAPTPVRINPSRMTLDSGDYRQRSSGDARLIPINGHR